MAALNSVLNQVQSLVAQLSPKERQEVIQAIASIKPAKEAALNSLSSRQRQLFTEQEAWFAQPTEEKLRYQGEFVAVRDGSVVDHDPSQRSLYLRVRERFGQQPIPILPASQSALREFSFHSVRQER